MAGAELTGQLTDVAVHAAGAAGAVLLEHYRDAPQQVTQKLGPADLVSAADLAADDAISQVLAARRPQDAVLSEEREQPLAGSSGLRWVVDPLDGTHNYLYRLGFWCVSVAVEDEQGPVAGVVFDPLHGELFCAGRGQGATLNGQRLGSRARTVTPLAGAMVGGGFGRASTPSLPRQAQLAGALSPKVGQLRMLGSAALTLAWTAAGRLDAFYMEARLKPWDKLAGMLLCAETGLTLADLPPLSAELAPRLLAAPEPLFGQLLKLSDPPVRNSDAGATGRS